MDKVMNEKGMALLFSTVILFLLTSVFVHLLAIYESEKVFLQLEQEWNSQDQLIITATKEVVSKLKEEEDRNLVAGKLDFISGSVHYQVIMENDVERSVLLQATTVKGKYRGARFRYNIEDGSLSNWVEGAQIR